MSLTEDSNTTTRLQKSETSSGEPSVNYRPPVRRSSEHSKGSLKSQRKRRNAGDSDCELSQQSELQSSEPSGLSQQLENQILAEVPGSHSSHVDLQQITPDTSAQAEKPASKKKKKKENEKV
jgi:hypothetical protein